MNRTANHKTSLIIYFKIYDITLSHFKVYHITLSQLVTKFDGNLVSFKYSQEQNRNVNIKVKFFYLWTVALL